MWYAIKFIAFMLAVGGGFMLLTQGLYAVSH
jgi:hypothetical protein